MMTNKSRTLYTGVTSDLDRRVDEHRRKLIEGFTKRYNLTKLVYYEAFESILTAIAREKQIKGWLRRKKVALIESVNPGWQDLARASPLSASECERRDFLPCSKSETNRRRP
jgi:putative endonuclease